MPRSRPRGQPLPGDAPPQVGLWYQVPAVLARGVWFPVRLPMHADPPVELHYHLDMRFMSRLLLRLLRDLWGGKKCQPRTFLPHECIQAPARIMAADDVQQLGLYPFRCVQRDRFGQCVFGDVDLGRIYDPVWRNGRPYCPHRGAALADVPVDDGIARCPLHGAWVRISGAANQ